MKKLLVLFVAILYVATSFAQLGYDADSHKRKILSIEAVMKDPKKNTKGATWLQRGDVYFQAYEAPIKGLYKKMPQIDIDRTAGTPSEKKTETLGKNVYDVLVFDNYDLYKPTGKNYVSFWIQKAKVLDNGLDLAFESYNKAIELEPKLAIKATPQLKKIVDAYKQDADMALAIVDYKRARNSFVKAYEYGLSPELKKVDTMLAYNAGYISIIIEDYDMAVKYLLEAKKHKFENKGELYKLMNYAYIGKKDNASAIEILNEGVQKYPNNIELIELLMTLYANEGKEPGAMISLVQTALEKDPNNYNLHFGLGVIYDKMNNYTNASEQFAAAAKISPNDFGAFYNLGVAYVRCGEALIPALNEIPASNQAVYAVKLAELNAFYKKSFEPLERAHELNPKDKGPIELLKIFYFRFRDESPEMMAKYEKYNALFQSM